MDEIERIRRFREGRRADEAAEEKARAKLIDALEASPREKLRSARWWVKAGAVTAAATALLVTLPLILPGGGLGSTAAATALNAVAGVAAEQPALADQDGYRYTMSECLYEWDTATNASTYYSVLMPITREIWIGRDGSGRILEKTGEPAFLSESGRQAWQAAGSPSLGGNEMSDETFPAGDPGGQGLYYQDFSALPADVDGLFENIRQQASQSQVPVDQEMLVIVGDLLRETFAPPQYRSALYQVAARIPGVELMGSVSDPAGRPGIGVAATWNASDYRSRYELIFDPETSEFLGERHILLDRVPWMDAEPPCVVGSAVYLSSGIVASTNDRP